MTFLFGPDLTAAIHSILAESNSRCAVAFWGKGCENWIAGSDARVICNLRMGGTNPYALEMVNADVRQLDRLHAKVYLGAKRAVVASANASINGLALEGNEQASWLEAGIETSDVQNIEDWFEDRWAEAREITPEDWTRAKLAWNRRPKPTIASFAEFDPTTRRIPLVSWVDGSSWKTDPVELERQTGSSSDQMQRRVAEGCDVGHSDDADVIKNRWILTWMRTSDGKPHRRQKPFMVQTSDFLVERGFTYDGDATATDVMLGVERCDPPPFDPQEPLFYEALQEVLGLPKFKMLRDDDNKESAWFKDREHLLADFWQAVKQAFVRLKSTAHTLGVTAS